MAIIKKKDWNPGLIEAFLNSNFLARKELFDKIKQHSGEFSGKILDVGCGTKPYADLFRHTNYIGLDIFEPMGGV